MAYNTQRYLLYKRNSNRLPHYFRKENTSNKLDFLHVQRRIDQKSTRVYLTIDVTGKNSKRKSANIINYNYDNQKKYKKIVRPAAIHYLLAGICNVCTNF